MTYVKSSRDRIAEFDLPLGFLRLVSLSKPERAEIAVTLCDLGILAEQAAEPVAPENQYCSDGQNGQITMGEATR